MPINTAHPEFSLHADAWQRIADCLGGPDSMRRNAARYIPAISGQTVDEFDKMVSRAIFFNATGRTHEAMVGFLFRKPPHSDLPSSMEGMTADAALDGQPLTSYARRVVYDVAAFGRCGTLVDYSVAENRPYFAFYPHGTILNWEEARIGGQQVLTLVVLAEIEYRRADGDRYERVPYTVYRALELINPESEAPFVQVTKWEERHAPQTDAKSVAPQTAPGTGLMGRGPAIEQVGEATTLMRRGKPLRRIPFVFHGAESAGASVDKPPLADISAVNVGHYQSSADLENGRHICGIPTPYTIGFDAGNDKLFLGASYAWTTDNVDASCGWMEFTGQGLSALEKAIAEKEGQMAALGARLIEPRSADAEAYETVQLRASAETSTLARIVLLTSEGITQALRIADWWMGTAEDMNPEIRYAINSDFSSAAIKPEMLTALISAYQQGAISRDTLFFQLQRGELFPEGWDMAAEMAAIEANPPMPPMLPPAPTPAK